MKRGLVFGCGGAVGYAWSLAALRRFEENTGWDARTADAFVGTSAGAVIAACLASGVAAKTLLERERAAARTRTVSDLPAVPFGRPLAAHLFGRGPALTSLAALLPAGRGSPADYIAPLDEIPTGAVHAPCWIVTMDVETGDRVAFGREASPSLREAVAASYAIPGWMTPVTIAGRRYIDGGAVSSASVDLLADEGLDEVLVFSPMTSHRWARPASLGQVAERILRAAMTRRLENEIAILEARGARVICIEPTARDLSLMGANFMDARHAEHVIAAW